MNDETLVLTPDEPPERNALPQDAEWPKTLALYVDTMAATLIREGVDIERATRLAERCTLALALAKGGGNVYLPIGEKLRHAARNRRIFLEWRGNNYAELMAKYHIGTERRLQQIVAEQAAIQQRLMQPDLFEAK